MPVTVACPSCKAKVKAPDRLIGTTVKCPNCGGPIKVAVTADLGLGPAPKLAPEAIAATPAWQPPAEPGLDELEVLDEGVAEAEEAVIEDRPRSRRPLEDEEDDRPRRRRRDEEDEEDDRPHRRREED